LVGTTYAGGTTAGQSHASTPFCNLRILRYDRRPLGRRCHHGMVPQSPTIQVDSCRFFLIETDRDSKVRAGFPRDPRSRKTEGLATRWDLRDLCDGKFRDTPTRLCLDQFVCPE